jgi:hypothetical protein
VKKIGKKYQERLRFGFKKGNNKVFPGQLLDADTYHAQMDHKLSSYNRSRWMRVMCGGAIPNARPCGLK